MKNYMKGSQKKQKILQVAAIENGTVLDHLPGEKVLKILEMLSLDAGHTVTLGINLGSKKRRKKGIIKISGRAITETEMNKIAILAPDATVNIIESYAVVKKKKCMLKDIEPNTIRCNNPNCITNHEEVVTRFYIIEKQPLKIQCYFCERSMDGKEINFL